jgi:hypothetical protein
MKIKNNKNSFGGFMKKNLLLLSLLCFFAPVAGMQQSEDASKTKEQQTASIQNNLKKYASLGLGLTFGALAKHRYSKQLHLEKTGMEPGYAYSIAGQERAKNFPRILGIYKNYRNMTIASALISGLFLYNALSYLTDKKLSLKIVNNDESK